MKDELLVESVANWCILESEEGTDSCDFCVSVGEITEHFGVTVDWVILNRQSIIDSIAGRSEIVADVDYEKGEDPLDDIFDLDIYGNYCDVDCSEDDEDGDDDDGDIVDADGYYGEIYDPNSPVTANYVAQSQWFRSEDEAVRWAKLLEGVRSDLRVRVMKAHFDKDGNHGDITVADTILK